MCVAHVVNGWVLDNMFSTKHTSTCYIFCTSISIVCCISFYWPYVCLLCN